MTAKDDRIQELDKLHTAAAMELEALRGEVRLALLDAPEDYKESLVDYIRFLEAGAEFGLEVQQQLRETLKVRNDIIQRLDDGWKPYFAKPDGDPVWYKTDALDPGRLIALHRMTDAERVEYHEAIAAPEEHPDSDAHTN